MDFNENGYGEYVKETTTGKEYYKLTDMPTLDKFKPTKKSYPHRMQYKSEFFHAGLSNTVHNKS